MKKRWLKYICDPIDKSNLEIHSVLKKRGDGIITGFLKSKTGNLYKIKNGVPVLLTKTTQSIESVASFGYEWNEFDFDFGKEGWLKDVITPIGRKTNFFRDKVIVDCGAGSGRQSRWMMEMNAKFVFCVELSNAAHKIIKRVTRPYRDNVFVIQADISHLPINPRNINIDMVYCVNVVQHTKNVQKTTIELSKLLRKNSTLLYNIYLAKNRKLRLKLLGLVRSFTKLVPYKLLKHFSFLVAFIFYPLSFLPIVRNFVKSFVPLGHDFKETWLCIYDLLGPHEYQRFYTDSELKNILDKSGLKIVNKTEYALLLKKKS